MLSDIFALLFGLWFILRLFNDGEPLFYFSELFEGFKGEFIICVGIMVALLHMCAAFASIPLVIIIIFYLRWSLKEYRKEERESNECI